MSDTVELWKYLFYNFIKEVSWAVIFLLTTELIKAKNEVNSSHKKRSVVERFLVL